MRLGRLLAGPLAVLAWMDPAGAVPLSIATDSTWTAADASGQDLGQAQAVCLSAGAPATCPAGATLWGYPYPGWTADLSSIPGAQWIWAPGVTGQSAPAAGATATFRAVFYLCGTPTGGTVSAAADNEAVVSINGAPVLTVTERDVLQTFSVPASALSRGLNVVEVTVTNAADPPSCSSGQFNCNPAGLVLGARFEDSLPAWPECQGADRPYRVGETERLACPAGLTGGRLHQCLCAGSSGFWGPVMDACMAPPPVTCRSPTTGAVFQVGATETVPCAAPQTGSQTRTCRNDGTFGPLSGACLAPVTCSDPASGATFAVGQTQAVPCTPPLVGTMARTCQANGSFGPPSGTCERPGATAGGLCGSREGGVVALCPAGTTCGPRTLPTGPRQWYCVLFGIDCPVRTVTADWFCDP